MKEVLREINSISTTSTENLYIKDEEENSEIIKQAYYEKKLNKVKMQKKVELPYIKYQKEKEEDSKK